MAENEARPELGLTTKQILALGALLAGKNQVEAAKEADVNERTVRLWLLQPEFSRALQDARGTLWTECTTRLHQLTREALDTLQAAMGDKEARVWERVQAARAVMEMSRKAADTEDLNQKIREIEAELAAVRAGQAAPGGEAPGG